MNKNSPATLRRLLTSSILYIIVSLIAGAVAIQANLPAQPMGEGSGSGKPVWQDFLFGGGTAMSPGLPWLIGQVILTILISRKDWLGTVGVIGLIIFGLLSGIFSITEPNVQKIFDPATFDPLKAAIETGIIIVPFAIMIFGTLEWRRRHDNK